ncbi:MAG TPA: ABC transporter ATP-binding protein [Gemmataceae bacterium]|nr:ABC transporter ATP-binding protein [Gemmataceae bacterium]
MSAPTADDETTLRCVSLVRSFGDGGRSRAVINEVSMDLHKGEITLLMGPSGSGKSTLLAILSGLLAPDSGQVVARDGDRMVNIWQLSPREREQFRLRNCGFIFQGYNLFPALTARQQLEIVLRWGDGVGGREARRRADEMLHLLGLQGKENKKPAQLSGGEKQRVAIGRALIKRPRFVFADEPTSALDWGSGQVVIDQLQKAAHEYNSTIIVVSHDHRLLEHVDVSYHLDDGRLTETDLPVNRGGFEPWRTGS